MALRRTGEGATTPRRTATRLSFIDAFGAVLAVGPALHVSPYPPVPAAVFATNGLVGSRRFRLGPPLSQAGRVTVMTIVRGGSSRGCTAPLPAPKLLAWRAGSPVILHTHIGPLGGHSALGEWSWTQELGWPRACKSGHLCPLWEAVSVRLCRHRSPPPTRLTPNSPNDHIFYPSSRFAGEFTPLQGEYYEKLLRWKDGLLSSSDCIGTIDRFPI